MQTRFARMMMVGLGVGLLGAAAEAQLVDRPRSGPEVDAAVARYAPVRLTADLGGLTPNQRQVLAWSIAAAKHMDEIFWVQSFRQRKQALRMGPAPFRKLIEINYGPWDRLDGERPFAPYTDAKPLGANFYPVDMTVAEFEKFITDHPEQAATFKSPYTIIRRDNRGKLAAHAYRDIYQARSQVAHNCLLEAAAYADNPALRRYLELRAKALITDDYQPSDLAWLDMKDNVVDVVIGPIETYEDRLFGYKAAHEAYVLVKDTAWSARLARYARFLPGLQKSLPVPDRYKQEVPGTDSDLNAYEVLFYAGHCNAGSKTIAINLPNDEEVQLKKGTRRLQLKNAMRAKYDKILVPISRQLIAVDQRKHITFDAFFGNTMFHEVAHGLGIKHTVNGQGPVRTALKEQASAVEEGKADILGLYMVTKLFEQGEIPQGNVMDNYVTFLAGIFRSVRFGASSAHGQANMLRFNFFEKMEAFSRDPATGHYRVNFDRMKLATEALAGIILLLQGDGDYDGAKRIMTELGRIEPQLRGDLDRLKSAGIPVDIVFEQGFDVLGLEAIPHRKPASAVQPPPNVPARGT